MCVCHNGFPWRSTVLAAQAFSDKPSNVDLTTTTFPHAIRPFWIMTQHDAGNDQMAMSIANHCTTHVHPVPPSGPIAIINNYIQREGGTIDDHFWVTVHDGTQVNVRLMPVQTIEQAIERASRKHNIKPTEVKRKRIDGAAHTDWTFTTTDMDHHKAEDHLALRAITAAGLWGKYFLHKAGLTPNSTCERCRIPSEETYHRFRTSSALRSTYDRYTNLLKNCRHGKAPACHSTCGSAPEVAGDLAGTIRLAQRHVPRRGVNANTPRHGNRRENSQTSFVPVPWARQDSRFPDAATSSRRAAATAAGQRSHGRTDSAPETPMGISRRYHVDRALLTHPAHTTEEELTGARTDRAHRRSSINNSKRMEPSSLRTRRDPRRLPTTIVQGR